MWSATVGPAALLSLAAVAVSLSSRDASAFSAAPQVRSRRAAASSALLSMTADDYETSAPSSPLGNLKLPNLFGGQSEDRTSGSDVGLSRPNPPSTLPPAGGFESNPEALFDLAKAVLASDLGVKDGSLLDDEKFVWIGPTLGSNVLGKEDYLAAGKFFDLRSAFPDLDYRAHDFRIDELDPFTVRLTARTVGTMRGELRLRSETLPPNGKRMRCPPEAISISFDETTGKVTKLCSGFAMDRLVGNTAGLCGVQAAATIAGAPPSEWELYPPAAVVGRFFGRTVKQLEDPSSFLAPFPETVMIQLAKGVIAANNGADDPDLLAPEFTFCGPVVGPLQKQNFVDAFTGFKLKEAFPDLDSGLTNFRVDPYDPYRVWADGRGRGTWKGPLQGKEPTGAVYEGPPEAVSFTFDDDGFCTRLTAGAVMDPSLGNTGGLGGVFGILYATGASLPGFSTRPIPQLLARLQKRAVKPFTGVDVDEFSLPKKQLAKRETVEQIIRPPAMPKPPSEEAKGSASPKKSALPPKPKAAAKPKVVAEPKLATTPKVTAKPQAAVKAKAPSPQLKTPTKKSPTLTIKNPFIASSKQQLDVAVATNTSAKQKFAAKPKVSVKQKAATTPKPASLPRKKATTKSPTRSIKNPFMKPTKEQLEAVDNSSKRMAAAKSKAVVKPKSVVKPKPASPPKRAATRSTTITIKNPFMTSANKQSDASGGSAKRKVVAQPKAVIKSKPTSSPPKNAVKKSPTLTINNPFMTTVTRQPKMPEPTKAKVIAKRTTTAKPKTSPLPPKESATKSPTLTIKNPFAASAKEQPAPMPVSKTSTTSEQKTSQTKKEIVPRASTTMISESPSDPVSEAFTNFFGLSGASKKKEPVTATREKKVVAAFLTEKQGGSNPFFLETKSGTAAPGGTGTETALEAKRKAEAAEAARKQRVKAAAATIKAKAEAAAEAKRLKAIAIAARKAKLEGANKQQQNASAGNAESEVPRVAKLFAPKKEPVPPSAPPPPPAKKVAPRGIPTLSRWRKNRDGSITGNISGTTAFRDGQRITTSAITSTELKSGIVVETESRSKYFLD